MLTFRKSTSPSASKRAPISAASSAPRPRRGPSSSSPTRRSPTARPAAADRLAHRLEHLDGEAHAVLERAAVGVGPAVAAGREELVDQVAVAAVDLDSVEAAGRRVARAAREVVDQLADLLDLERLRRLVIVGHDARRPGGQPRPGAVVDAAVVRELEQRERAGAAHLRGEPLEVRNRRLVPGRRIVRHLVGGGRVHLTLAGDDDAHFAPLREVAPEPLAVEAGLSEASGRLAVHREVGAEDDPVARGVRPQAQGREEPREQHDGRARQSAGGVPAASASSRNEASRSRRRSARSGTSEASAFSPQNSRPA